MTRGVLKLLDDSKTYQLSNKRTTIGRDLSCDVCLNNVLVELNHAAIEYVDSADSFVIKDFNTPHGTYVNDCRVQNAVVRLAHGDILRLGHGGPKFEVSLHIQSYPPVVLQHAWNSSTNTDKNLPYIPAQPSLEDSLNNNPGAKKILSNIKYGRQNGYHAHNKTEENPQQNLRPHPPQRSRPLSANPCHNSTLIQPNVNSPLLVENDYSTKFSGWYQQQNKKLSDQILDLEGQLLKMGDELSRLSSYESECSRKEIVIEGLRNELNQQQKNNVSGLRQATQIQSLQNQIVSKDHEIKRLKEDFKKKNADRNEFPNKYTNQIAQMKTTLTRHEQVVAILESDLKKLQQNKLQLTEMINTLKKEATSKDMLVKKWKSECEKMKIELNHKNIQFDDLQKKYSKQDVVDELRQQLRMKDEEISRLLNKNRRSEEVVREKDSILENLQDSSRKLTANRQELQQRHNEQRLDYEYSLARVEELEKQKQTLKTESNYWKQKLDRLQEKLRSALASEDSFVNDGDSPCEDQMFDVLNELKKQKNRYEQQLHNHQKDKMQLEIQVSKMRSSSLLDQDIQICQDFFTTMNKRLSLNGRSCKNLANEMNMIETIQLCDQLIWLKDLMMSVLSHEYNWESDIESALTNLKEDELCSNNDPSYLIRQLHEKLQDNTMKINQLEIKIHTSEDNHLKEKKDTKERIKEKYKTKTEKAIKETRFEEYDKYKKELEKCQKENEKKLIAMQDHNRILLKKEETNKKALNKKVECLKKDKESLNELVFSLQEKLRDYEGKQEILKEELDEKEQRSKIREEIIEQKLKEQNEMDIYLEKEKNRELSMKVIDLENNLLDLNEVKKELEYKIISMEQNLKESKLCEESSRQDIEMKAALFRDEIKELKDTNIILREDLTASKEECNDLKEVVKSLKKDINGMSARITDLKGEMSDKDKEELENLSQIISEKDNELISQRKQLMELSSLLEQQKIKLLEQDEKIVEQNNNLAYQNNEKHAQVTTLDLSRSLSRENLDDSIDGRQASSPSTLSAENIAERCIAKRHEQIIKKQKLALAEMRSIITSLEHLKPPVPSHELALVEISNLKKELSELKLNEIERQDKVIEDNDKMYDEVCLSRSLLKSANHEVKVESESHRETQDALHLSEDMYLKLLRGISESLEIQHVLGCKPIGYTPVDERKAIVKEREKACEVILSRIKTLRTRLERKDKLLESYDIDLRSLRETERLAGKKSAQAKDLESQVLSYKDEISYLQEALRKCRKELDEQRRLNIALKENKVFMMDYQDDVVSKKSHNCHVDEQQKYKDEQRLKKKDDQIKKQKYEIQTLKQELLHTDMELSNANQMLAHYEEKDEKNAVKNEADRVWRHVTGDTNDTYETPVRDTDPVGRSSP